ncbi:siderophore-interacting protein [Corticibacterium sp. UT-5YL-CI-8]|nr:siderophore-interacting protein [Tianweitania sp. UT-5YL-CI-8]
MTLTSRAEVSLSHLPSYLDSIVDRLGSYHPEMVRLSERAEFRYPFGLAALDFPQGRLVMTAEAPDTMGLARVKDLVAVAVQLYAKSENPRIVWTGDLAGETRLEQFRLMRVTAKHYVTPRMLRVRLAGEDLVRFGLFGGMHIRMLFATPENPDPVWPVMGENGLPSWPSEARRPVSRAYTVRTLDAEAGWIDVDFVMHEDHGVASSWAVHAELGDTVGVLGPVGRPLKSADWYVLGADETGLPAVGRLLESLSPDTKGIAYLEVENAAEEQELKRPDGFDIRWLHRNGDPTDTVTGFSDLVCNQSWPDRDKTFGWFAAEASVAKKVREHWRVTRGLGRDRTLVAGYWQRDSTGFMAG